jgi:hypothetical protein
MDSYSEQLVYRYPSGGDNAKKFATYAVAILLALAVVLLTMATVFAGIGLLLAAGLAWLGYYIGTRQHVEYEYIVTNGELDIDKVVAKSKRTRLLTVKSQDFTAFGEYTDEVPDDESLTLVLASENSGVGDWYADFETDAYGKTRLVFTPNLQTLESIKPYLRHGLRLQK